MKKPPKYIRVAGRVYRLAEDDEAKLISDAQAALSTARELALQIRSKRSKPIRPPLDSVLKSIDSATAILERL